MTSPLLPIASGSSIALSLRQLIGRLHLLTGAAAPPSTPLHQLLLDVPLSPTLLAPFAHHVPGAYTRNLIYRCDSFELLCVCWSPGSTSPIHDHGEQECFMRVVAGRLRLHNYALTVAAQHGCVGESIGLRRLGLPQWLELGDVDHRGGHAAIHRVCNPAVLRQTAMSLHLYARPLDRCITYARGRASRVDLGYDSVPSPQQRASLAP